MTKFLCVTAATALVLSAAALAQTGSAQLPAAPSSASQSNSAASVPTATGDKVASINIDAAIYGCNEGQRDFDALSKKLEPKQAELKKLNDEVEDLKKQASSATEAARVPLVRQIEQKQKVLERSMQDAREDAQNQQSEIAQRILQKMAPVLLKFAADNGYGMVLDTSKPWPDGPVIWAGQTVDITRGVVDAYNVQSGVPAPPKPAASAAPRTAPPARTTPPASTTPK